MYSPSLRLIFDDTELFIDGYNKYRNDSNGYGGGVAFYIQNHLQLKMRMDLMDFNIEKWLQVLLPYRKSIILLLPTTKCQQ